MNYFSLTSADYRVELLCSDFRVSMMSHEDAVSEATGGWGGGFWRGTMGPCPRMGPTSCNNEGCLLAICGSFKLYIVSRLYAELV